MANFQQTFSGPCFNALDALTPASPRSQTIRRRKQSARKPSTRRYLRQDVLLFRDDATLAHSECKRIRILSWRHLWVALLGMDPIVGRGHDAHHGSLHDGRQSRDA
jgi:hypothetical protein